MDDTYSVRAIGEVRSDRAGREDDDWGSVESVIRLDDRFGPEALTGLDEFSHIEVVFVFDRFDEAKVNTSARHPRGNEAWPKVGIFAQRASSRPNRLGLTTCELIGVDGLDVRVRGLDAIDGTPVLDIKPFVREFQPRTDVRQPPWIGELMVDYW
ncbi:MAG: S-adenosylmethionine-dependent methyltransferase [Acidimicrobiales bacterium]|nr:MAG: S-adenosylmethionine-dependent methyltransferase [Acidimicrobiales bacterium]